MVQKHGAQASSAPVPVGTVATAFITTPLSASEPRGHQLYRLELRSLLDQGLAEDFPARVFDGEIDNRLAPRAVNIVTIRVVEASCGLVASSEQAIRRLAAHERYHDRSLDIAKRLLSSDISH